GRGLGRAPNGALVAPRRFRSAATGPTRPLLDRISAGTQSLTDYSPGAAPVRRITAKASAIAPGGRRVALVHRCGWTQRTRSRAGEAGLRPGLLSGGRRPTTDSRTIRD